MATKTGTRFVTLMAGILTAVVIVVSQLFYFEKPVQSKDEAKTDQHTEQSSDGSDTNSDAYITLPSSTLPSSSTHVEFQQQSFCLFEIIYPEKDAEQHDFSVTLPLSKFFQTLFHTLISPNAP